MSRRPTDLRSGTAHFPVHNFLMSDSPERQIIVSGVMLKRVTQIPEFTCKALCADERRSLAADVAYWLEIIAPRADGASAVVLAHTWIFALWLVRPTNASIHHRFEEFDEPSAFGWARLLSRASYNKFDVDFGSFSGAEIQQAVSYFTILQNIRTSTRLELALSLSVESTWVHRWSPGLMLASAAVESLLTYSEGPRISARHARAYAAIVPSSDGRDAARERFAMAYRKRSKLVHGRLPPGTDDDRLKNLAEWSKLLRSLWREVLTRPELFTAIQGDDEARRAFFTAL